MTIKKKMPLQVKVVLVVLWLQLMFGGLVAVVGLRHIQSDIGRTVAEIFVVLVFLFTIYVNYCLGTGSRWAYRFIQVGAGIAIAKFIFNVAMNKGISPFQIAAFALNVAMLMLLLASASQAFYQKRN